MDSESYRIEPARSSLDIDHVMQLFIAYVEWLGIDLTFQDFEGEKRAMPGKYAPPKGELLLARDRNRRPIGCVALRPMDEEGCCEMKRLYVSPDARGLRLGHALVKAIIDDAASKGYREMKLDSLDKMVQARSLYKKFGFVETSPYYDNPIPGAVFLSCTLS
ncbi:putative GNAT family acetyltransferase [Lineolata rhizophorae]|uniref:Putative GNAT family acetyltransferase n=1 Tax=Lineolata rhizophorae TaxID=578093 RepID=A0A6A6PCP3_9PEZI|nr:putative GNAT family acetyltransferase [Lineolata rhizophorae]